REVRGRGGGGLRQRCGGGALVRRWGARPGGAGDRPGQRRPARPGGGRRGPAADPRSARAHPDRRGRGAAAGAGPAALPAAAALGRARRAAAGRGPPSAGTAPVAGGALDELRTGERLVRQQDEWVRAAYLRIGSTIVRREGDSAA